MAEVKIAADSGGGSVGLVGPASTTGNAAIQLKLPVDDGSANQVLQTDGSGNLSWYTIPDIAIGGTITEYVSGGTTYRVHSFLAGSSKFSTTKALTVDYLLVGGGGGSTHAEGANGSVGGAGAGGMVEATSQAIAAGNYTVVVGAGGAKGTNAYASGGDGGNSTFNGHTATGGGGSGDYNTAGRDGGSGAGGSENNQAAGSTNQNTYSGVTNVTGYGNNGGAGATYSGGTQGSGSGGGAGGAGSAGANGLVAGGVGRANNYRTGSNVTYARGGNGHNAQYDSADEADNTGNGAHGVSTTSGNNNDNSGDGGSGIVVIRYAVS